MALSGEFYGSTSNNYIIPKIVWTAEPNAASGYTSVTATLYYSRTNDYITGGTWSGSLTVNGNTASAQSAFNIGLNSNTKAISHSVKVYHSAETTITISALGAIAGSSLTSTTISGKITLPALSKASTVAASSAAVTQTAIVTVSRKDKSYTHSIAYRFGSLQGYLTADGTLTDTEVRFSGESIGFYLPEEFYYQIPSKPSGVCTLTCRTYNGTALVGQPTTAEFTVSTIREKCQPALICSIDDANPVTSALTGDTKALISGYSCALCTITATPRYGATIKNKTIAGVAVSGDSLTIENVLSSDITFTATDSRGYAVSSTDGAAYMLAYTPVTNNATASRPDAESNVTITFSGNFDPCDFGAQRNELQLGYRVAGEEEFVPVTPELHPDGTYSATVIAPNLSYKLSHKLELLAQDKLTSVCITVSTGKCFPLFQWDEEKFRFRLPVEVPELTIGGRSLENVIKSVIKENNL